MLTKATNYNECADVFDGFKNNKIEFRAKYSEDVKSLIALHEAAQLSIEGEDSLDDAGYLSCQLLHAWLKRHTEHDEAYVDNALQHPLHYGLSRFRDTSIVPSDYKTKKEWTCLERLAEINSCIVRIMNQNEITQVYK